MLKKSRQIRAHNEAASAAAAAAAAAADSPPPPGLAKSDDLALEFANSHTQPTDTHSCTRQTFFLCVASFSSRSRPSSVSRALFVVTSCLPASQPARQPASQPDS